jgi:hypothetical protein
MKSYAGVCRGGPRDGQQVAHDGKKFEITKPVVDGWGPLGYGPVFGVEFMGEYRFVLGQWVWRGASVDR